jgi:hypothetical protein
MPFVETNLRLLDTKWPDIATYLPPWNYVLGFPTSIRQNSIGSTVNNPRVITRLNVSVVDTMPETLFLDHSKYE